MPLLELQPFGVTDPGKVRQNNEDALLVGDYSKRVTLTLSATTP